MMHLLRQSLFRLACSGALVAACWGGTAYAGPGDHVKVGPNTTLTPDVDVGVQFRTNVTQSAVDPIGGVNLTVAPGARLEHVTPDTQVSMSGDYRLVKYFTRALSQADQFNDFDVRFDGQFLKSRPLGFVLSDRASLVNNNANNLGNTPFHTRFRNDLQGGIQLRPGAVLQLEVQGRWQYDRFSVPPGKIDGSDTRGLNARNGFGATWDAEWRFFPRTALVIEGDYTAFRWDSNLLAQGALGGFLAMPDSTHFRVLSGIRGRFTERVVLTAQLGYGSAPYSVESVQTAGGGEPSPAQPFDAKLAGAQRLLAALQLQYELDENRTIILGYRKDFDDVFFTNFMAYHRVYGAVSSRFGTRVQTDANVSVRQESYRGQVQRNDVFVNVQGDVSYFLQDWAKVTAGLGYQQRISGVQSVSYNDVQGRLLMTFSY